MRTEQAVTAATALHREAFRGHPVAARSGGRRFLFCSHDGLGFGRTRRNLAIANAIAQNAPDASILLTTDADEINRNDIPPQV